jgi:hypothetical protein
MGVSKLSIDFKKKSWHNIIYVVFQSSQERISWIMNLIRQAENKEHSIKSEEGICIFQNYFCHRYKERL